VKLFFSREQTFVITIKNAKHKLFNYIHPNLRQNFSTLCISKKRPTPTMANTAKRKKQAVSSHFRTFSCATKRGATIKPTRRKEKWDYNWPLVFIALHSAILMSETLRLLARQLHERKENLSPVDDCNAK